MRISLNTAETIRQQMNVLEVVEDFLSLKRKGNNWWAPCPFHNERTASFSVNPAKGIYKCFGCGAGGDAITFIMEHEQLSYPEALAYLAKKYNIEVEYEGGSPDEHRAELQARESLLIAMEYAKQYYQKHLYEHEDGRIGQSYFKERGFLPQTVKHFELGFSPAAWDAFTQHALGHGYTLETLIKAGLSSTNEAGKTYDRFRERVMFPIHNLAGKVIAFGARLLTKEAKQAKYLNSPETPIYHKGQVLYGLYFAKKAIRELNECLLVEGYTDVISLHQAGIKHVVSSSGTALTVEQIRLIGRFTPNVTVVYDGDAAGIKAALRGLDLILEQGLNVKVAVLPDGQDPDSYVQAVGEEAFRQYLDTQATDFITFKTALFLQDAGNDPLKRTEVLREIVQSIAKIPDAIARAVWVQHTSERMRIGEETIMTEVNKLLLKAAQKQSAPTPESEAPEAPPLPKPPEEALPSALLQQERENIRMLLYYAHYELEQDLTLCRYFLQEIADLKLQNPIYQKIADTYKQYLLEGEVPVAEVFLTHPDPEVRREVAILMAQKREVSNNWYEKHEVYIPKDEEMLGSLVYRAILHLKLRHIREQIRLNMQALEAATTPEAQDELLQVAMALKALEKDIATFLGNVIMR
ncbi:DNA primase [Eisenibacter elegans]|jgi:DNA primase|uniref:DNA primase n=1 Tax=Eisenibacter elegans TaxID=997 RepID=UPI00047C13C5|nr:DNA primase [Eisenibacter elegans]